MMIRLTFQDARIWKRISVPMENIYDDRIDAYYMLALSKCKSRPAAKPVELVLTTALCGTNREK